MSNVINAKDRFQIHEESSIVEEMGDMKAALDRLDPHRTALSLLSFEDQLKELFGEDND